MKINHILLLLCLPAILCLCVYPYEAKNVDELDNILVVEGDIIANGITTVKLSRSVALSADKAPSPERQATVIVEGNDGKMYPGTEISAGVYEVASTSDLNTSLKYRLLIQTADGSEYASEYVPVCISPPIDSLGYVVNPDRTELKVHVTTHDPTNQTRYYRWTYEENWQYHATYLINIEFDPITGRYTERSTAHHDLYYCWNKGSSSSILIDNSLKLSEDIIYCRDLLSLDYQNQRTSHLYCIQVTQRGLTSEAYDYWNNLYKNTEGTGGIFSPQPNELRGNIHSLTNPHETVLGYINASTTTISDRLFIYAGILYPYPYPECKMDTMRNFSDALWHYDRYWYPISITPAIWTEAYCVDCKVIGGTKNKPSWWPNTNQ